MLNNIIHTCNFYINFYANLYISTGTKEYATACQVKKVSFFNGTHMHICCVFALIRGITIFKRKMASLPENGTDPPFHENTDLTTTIENTKMIL